MQVICNKSYGKGFIYLTYMYPPLLKIPSLDGPGASCCRGLCWSGESFGPSSSPKKLISILTLPYELGSSQLLSVMLFDCMPTFPRLVFDCWDFIEAGINGGASAANVNIEFNANMSLSLLASLANALRERSLGLIKAVEDVVADKGCWIDCDDGGIGRPHVFEKADEIDVDGTFENADAVIGGITGDKFENADDVIGGIAGVFENAVIGAVVVDCL